MADPDTAGRGGGTAGDYARDESRDTAMPDASIVVKTPARQAEFFIPPSGSLSRPVTRSVTRSSRSAANAEGSSSASGSESGAGWASAEPTGRAAFATPLFQKLRVASSKPARATAAKLEDAQDTPRNEDDEQKQAQDDETAGVGPRPSRKRKASTQRARSSVSQPRPPRRSKRISPPVGGTSRQGTPRAAISEIIVAPAPKRGKGNAGRVIEKPKKLATRRSARLSKPLTVFHRYAALPPELKLSIWEAAIEPRVVYVRNKPLPSPNYDVQTQRPNWFMTCNISVAFAKKNYESMANLRSPAGAARTFQVVNPDVDVVVLEPCCSGCRGYHCCRSLLTERDRAAVRFLAVQTESPLLLPSTMPCWASLSLAWPRLETLYLMLAPLTGDQRGGQGQGKKGAGADKALVRVAETGREAELRKRFEGWKKEAGRERKIANLEFVVVVDRETEGRARDRYQGIENRRTGLPEDIVVG